MSKNLSISLDSFRREWEESYLANRGNCEHHDLMKDGYLFQQSLFLLHLEDFKEKQSWQEK